MSNVVVDSDINYLDLFERRSALHAQRNATKEEFYNIFSTEVWNRLIQLVKISTLLNLYKQILEEITANLKEGDSWEDNFIAAMTKTSIIHHCHVAYPALTECVGGINLAKGVNKALNEAETELSDILSDERAYTLYQRYTAHGMKLNDMKIQMNRGQLLSNGMPHFF